MTCSKNTLKENNLLSVTEFKKTQNKLLEKYLDFYVEPVSIDMAFFYNLQATFKHGMTMNEVRNALRKIDKDYVEGDIMVPMYSHLGYYNIFTYKSSDNGILGQVWDFEFIFYHADFLIGFAINLYPDIPNFNEQVLTLFVRENGTPDVIYEEDDHVVYSWINSDNRKTKLENIFYSGNRITIDIGKNIFNNLICRIAFNDPGDIIHQGPINGMKFPWP